MADVLIVCVREDEPQAKALAEMFEAAGFSIGGAPSSDGALRSSGAGVVVWSQASIRSRPFLDAAQRVINANKAVVASLIEPPPPSSIGDSPAFDLSRWDGDPNDPALDPLFFAVDRMVNSARASVGAQTRHEDFDPPPAPPPRAAPRPPPPAAPVRQSAPPADPLGSEAEHWRAIRDSRNPTDFMDYLSRYGPQGAFAEVAELRLKQLTASGAAAARMETPAPTRYPPQRAEAPPRRDPPPPRRTEPALPPARRAEAPRRTPPPDRSFDRADLRDPPRGEGGALRAFVLIALLGGAALAGGLYFGGGMGDMGANAPGEQSADAGAAPLDAPGEVPLGEPGDVEPPPVQVLDRPAQTVTREAPPPAPREREREREATPPPRTTVAANTPPSSGPISLVPGNSANPAPASASTAASVVVPLAPPQTNPVAPSPASDPAQLRGTSGSVVWAQRPSARRIADLYPQRALREGMGGRVQLDCTVQPSLSVSCTIASESPAGEGFGRAALSASDSYRARPTLSDGTSAVGARARIAVAFQAPQ